MNDLFSFLRSLISFFFPAKRKYNTTPNEIKKIKEIEMKKLKLDKNCEEFNDDLVGRILSLIEQTETGGEESKNYNLWHSDYGKSGYSIGKVQFDVAHNSNGISILRKCGLQGFQIKRLKSIQGDYDENSEPDIVEMVDQVNKEMLKQENRDFVDNLCFKYVKFGLKRIFELEDLKIDLTFYNLCLLMDYHNQFVIDINGAMHNFLKSIDVLTDDNYLEFKYSMKWGRTEKGREDIDRRFEKIKKVFKDFA